MILYVVFCLQPCPQISPAWNCIASSCRAASPSMNTQNWLIHTDLYSGLCHRSSQKAVTAHFSSEHIPPSGFARRYCWPSSPPRDDADEHDGMHVRSDQPSGTGCLWFVMSWNDRVLAVSRPVDRIPAHAIHWPKDVLMLAQRLRRWANIKTSSGQCIGCSET